MNDDRPAAEAPSSSTPPGDGSAAAARERFRQTQEVHLDLREPVTREEVGVAAGEPDFILERGGGDRFLDVELTLPGGQVLDVPAIGVVFANDVGDPRDAPVQNIIVNSVAEDVPSARAAISAAAPVLGLDAAAVDRFFERLRESKTEDSGRVFDGKPVGYLRPTVEVFYRGSERRVAINYSLAWDAPSPSSDSGPSAAPA